MSPVHILITHGMVALAFFVLWTLDRKQTYLYWWGSGHLFQAVSIATGFGMPLVDAPVVAWYVPAHGFAVGMVSASFIKGACEYREIRFSRRYVLVLVALITLLVSLLAGVSSLLESRMLGGLPVALSLLTVATLLWPCGVFEKFTALVIVLRSATVLVFTLAGQNILVFDQAMFNSYGPIIINASSLMLLITAFRHNLTSLNSHNELFSLSHAITTSMYDVSEERELANRLLKQLISQQGWSFGVLSLPEEDGSRIVRMAEVGPPELNAMLEELTERASSRTFEILSQKEAIFSEDCPHDPFFTAETRQIYGKYGIRASAMLPLVHDGQSRGLLLLGSKDTRSLGPAEQKTLESIAHVVALRLAHARNMRDTVYRANHDLLTNLGNRTAFHDYFEQHLRGKTPSTLILFDLDHFKEVNDALGHGVGDQLLKNLAERLRQRLVNENCQLFRLGGDEFVALYHMPDSGEDPQRIAEKLLGVIKEPCVIDDLNLQTSAALGVVTDLAGARDSHELLRCADLAMYKAKQQESRIALYDDKTDIGVQKKLQLISDVTVGVQKNEFTVFYQPIVDLGERNCGGCEALVRWNHPRNGVVRAGAFMDIIEATNLIRPLTYSVIDKVIEAVGCWQGGGNPPKVSINLSTRNLLDRGLLDYLLEQCRDYRVDPRLLQFEITETILMQDPKSAAEFLSNLRDAGFGIALDDFGTGFSSLSYLSQFPITVLKIDGCFVGGVRGNERNLKIIEATIGLSHKLGITTTAEGVERQEEDAIIRQLGCDQAQGYFYAHPLPKAEFEAWRSTYNLPADTVSRV